MQPPKLQYYIIHKHAPLECGSHTPLNQMGRARAIGGPRTRKGRPRQNAPVKHPRGWVVSQMFQPTTLRPAPIGRSGSA